MQYLHHPEAGAARLRLEGKPFRYLFKVRRLKADEPLPLRNLRDDCLHLYRAQSVDRRRAELELTESRELRIAPRRFLHLGWCIVDPRTIEKALPMLNEIGVGAISFLPCRRSQRNFRLDRERLERILVNSSQQCGRSVMMQLHEAESLQAFLEENPAARLLDFSSHTLPCGGEGIEALMVGPEGGWTAEERALFPPENIVGFDTPLILRSESAVCAASSRILLG
ncbi:16S rRNA (uracil(1498)-N(3))-methyltransferase [Nitratifractor sp.]